ncbi:hypothetical protein EOM39_05255 [Candidatus Gracilibacteria bacterium]|nr:hypothetical protein [Candidatus Gracilibacteria bacterium]
MSKFIDFGRIKLNTVELEEGLYPNGKVEDFCKEKVSGEELDKNPDFFSEENRKKAFGDNYKSNNEIEITEEDGSTKKVNIPTIINGGMGTNVSSASLVEAMNKLGFGGHLSSIGIGFYHYYESHKELFKENFNFDDGLCEIVQKDFDKLFKEELGLSEEFIENHFFICDELSDEKNPNKKNKGFNGQLGKERISRMMDLVAVYRQTMDLKSRGNSVGINCMYKTTSYLSSLKIAALCGIDYVTTAAGNPTMNPKVILKKFKSDLDAEGKKCSVPAIGLLVSSNKIINDFDYDYYIFEEGEKAGGHILRMGDKFKELEKIKDKFKKAGKEIPPIYAAGGVSTNKEIKEALDAGFDGVQLGTLPAVSEEACNGDGKEFKERLIGGNHLGKDTDIDIKFNEGVEKTITGFLELLEGFNSQILSVLDLSENEQESIEVSRVRDYLFKIIYNDFFDQEIKTLEELSEKEQGYYNKIKNFFVEKYQGSLEKISKVFRDLGNAKKFMKEFDKYIEENGKFPNMLVFDSTAGFPGRTKIIPNMYEIIAGNIKPTGCVGCLTDCICAGRGNVREDRGSKFCIYNWLNYLNPDNNIAFTGRSTVPYAEIRPLKDIAAYLMGTYVER